MNENTYILNLDENKPFEYFLDFHGTQVFWINTNDSDTFIKAGKEFYDILAQKIDKNGLVQAIFIINVLPSLSTIFRFIEHSPTSEKIKWTAVAGIEPENSKIFHSLLPLMNYGLSLTPERNKFKVKLFENKYKSNLEEVVKWLNKTTEDKRNSEIKSEYSIKHSL